LEEANVGILLLTEIGVEVEVVTIAEGFTGGVEVAEEIESI
jgi:hypothetical protein